MKLALPAWAKAPSAAGWAAIVIIAALVAAALWFLFVQPTLDRRAAARDRGALIIGNGDSAATEKAASAISDLADRQSTREDLNRTNADDIRSAPGASDPISPGVADARLRALCLRHAYAASDRCLRLQSKNTAQAPR